MALIMIEIKIEHIANCFEIGLLFFLDALYTSKEYIKIKIDILQNKKGKTT